MSDTSKKNDISVIFHTRPSPGFLLLSPGQNLDREREGGHGEAARLPAPLALVAGGALGPEQGCE